jgi:uncharacterized protein YjbI with pentapeptide repeats
LWQVKLAVGWLEESEPEKSLLARLAVGAEFDGAEFDGAEFDGADCDGADCDGADWTVTDAPS